MTRTTITKSIAGLSLAATALAGFGGTAHAQTREHVLLARQTQVPSMAEEQPTEALDIQARIDRLPTAIIAVRWEKIAVP